MQTSTLFTLISPFLALFCFRELLVRREITALEGCKAGSVSNQVLLQTGLGFFAPYSICRFGFSAYPEDCADMAMVVAGSTAFLTLHPEYLPWAKSGK